MSESLVNALLIGGSVLITGALFELALWAAYRLARARSRKRDRR